MMSVPILWRTSRSLLWFHRWRYAGLALVVLVTTTLGVGELLLVQALRTGGLAFANAATAAQRHQLAEQVDEISTLLIIMLVLTASIALLLVASSTLAVISSRSVELKLLRLSGAARVQVQQIVACETLLLVLVVGVVGSLLGVALVPTLFQLYTSLGAFGTGLNLTRYVDPALMLTFVAVQALVVTIVAFIRAGKVQVAVLPVRLRGHRRPRLWAGAAVRLVVLAVGVGLVLSLSQGVPDAGQIAVVAPLAVTIGLVAVAVYVIPFLVWGISKVLATGWPGTFTLIAERAFGDRERLASVATPLLISVGLLGGFIYSTGADGVVQRAEYLEHTSYETRVQTTSYSDAQQFVSGIGSGQETSVIMGEPEDAVIDGRDGLLVAVSDTGALMRLLGGETLDATNKREEAGSVALSSEPGTEIGETIVGRTQAGQDLEYRVIETANDLPLEAYWVPLTTDGAATDNTQWTVYTTVSPTDVTASGAFDDSAEVSSRSDVAEENHRERLNSSLRSNVSIFGTVYAMAFVALIQVTTLTTAKRADEFRLLQRIGLSRRAVLAGVLAESVLIAVAVFITLSVAFFVLAAKFSADLNVNAVSAYFATTPPTLLVHASMSAVLVASILISGYTTTRDGPR